MSGTPDLPRRIVGRRARNYDGTIRAVMIAVGKLPSWKRPNRAQQIRSIRASAGRISRLAKAFREMDEEHGDA